MNNFLTPDIFETAALIQVAILAFVAWLIYAIVTIVLPPVNFPNNIPTIPFYVSFLGTYTKMDQQQIYNLYLRRKLESHGAVKIYFASRWNILVTKPEFLVEVFKNEHIYTKSGNHQKIPSSILSSYTGDNIISAHGDVWKLYRSIVGPSIQFPCTDPVSKNCVRFTKILEKEIAAKGSTLHIADLLQKFTLQNIGESILGVDFNALNSGSKPSENELHRSIKYVKSQIFKPLYMSFPILDKMPIPSRIKARREVAHFRTYFEQLLKKLRKKDNSYSNFATNKLISALDKHEISLAQFTDNAIILMVAGHENPLLLILSLLYVIAKYPEVQSKIRQEISSSESHPYLTSVIYETLRMYPPLGQIINRLTIKPVLLGGSIRIPKGTYVGYNNFGTGRDTNVWGKHSDEFLPTRWGESYDTINESYSRAKRSARLPAFHGWKRACLGEKFALFEVRALLIQVLTNYTIRLDPNWKEKLTPAGPICPVMLQIHFERNNQED